MSRPLSGLIAAPHTAFKRDGSLNLAVIERQAALLDRNGVAGAFVCGTTGEGSSLTAAERLKVATRWRAAKPERLALIMHVGHPSLQESIAFARHAARIKADAIAAIAPSFFKPARVEELVAYCAAIAAAAPGLPFYYYHMPAMTGVNFSAVSFLKLSATRIPTLAGIKFTHEDLMDFAAASTFAGDRYNLMFGRDEILLAGLSLGATSAVGSTYNFAAPLYRKIIRAFKAGDLAAARRGQLQAIAMIEVLNAHGGLAAGKAVMGLIGLDCGPVRLPLRALDAEEIGRLRAGLEAAGFFDHSSRLA
jgi:N-acetylneuraminate lyase